MINFINENDYRPQITKIPNIDFGISAQSPQEFHNSHTIISNHSYINPFVNLDQIELTKILNKNKKTLQKKQRWTTRVHLSNYSNINNQNGFLTGRIQIPSISSGLNHSQLFDQNFSALLKQNKKFHKKKGQMTQYLQNHIGNTDFIGPIIGDQRTFEKYRKRKQEQWHKKQKNLQLLKEKHKQIQTNRSLSPLVQKTRIHRQRFQLQNSVHQLYEQKKHSKQKLKMFELPKINKSQLKNSISEVKSNYKKYKNETISRSMLMNSFSLFKNQSCVTNSIRIR